jgi:hypothetical protein
MKLDFIEPTALSGTLLAFLFSNPPKSCSEPGILYALYSVLLEYVSSELLLMLRFATHALFDIKHSTHDTPPGLNTGGGSIISSLKNYSTHR